MAETKVATCKTCGNDVYLGGTVTKGCAKCKALYVALRLLKENERASA